MLHCRFKEMEGVHLSSKAPGCPQPGPRAMEQQQSHPQSLSQISSHVSSIPWPCVLSAVIPNDPEWIMPLHIHTCCSSSRSTVQAPSSSIQQAAPMPPLGRLSNLMLCRCLYLTLMLCLCLLSEEIFSQRVSLIRDGRTCRNKGKPSNRLA